MKTTITRMVFLFAFVQSKGPIANEQMQAGVHQLTWNATNENGKAIAKGIYYLKFNAGNYAETKKISVIK